MQHLRIDLETLWDFWNKWLLEIILIPIPYFIWCPIFYISVSLNWICLKSEDLLMQNREGHTWLNFWNIGINLIYLLLGLSFSVNLIIFQMRFQKFYHSKKIKYVCSGKKLQNLAFSGLYREFFAKMREERNGLAAVLEVFLLCEWGYLEVLYSKYLTKKGSLKKNSL